jgi:putative endonuclease
MTKACQTLGKWGETEAVTYLLLQGYDLLEKNFRTPYGELDLIVQSGSGKNAELVFVEVKTRSRPRFGLPEISMNQRKQAHLIAAAEHYLSLQNNPPQTLRIDVIAIERKAGGIAPEITHFENAVTDPN